MIHTSDVHLDGGSEPAAGPLAEAEAGFVKVVEQVLELEADMLLIAGDLFDSNRVYPPIVDFVADQLQRLRCPVVLIPGNHDCYDEASVYRRFDFRELGSNVVPLTAENGEVAVFEELDVTIWGKGLVDHHPGNKPMAGLPARATQGWFIGMAHGFFVEDPKELRSSLITPDEIASSDLDYLALGHVHVFRDVSQGGTRAFYPGVPSVQYAPERSCVAVVDFEHAEGVLVSELRLNGVAAS